MEPSGHTQGMGLALLRCYNQLRDHIQALLTENDELIQTVSRLQDPRHLHNGPTGALPTMAPRSAPPAVHNVGGHFAFPSPGYIPEVNLSPVAQSSVLQAPVQDSALFPLAQSAPQPSTNSLEISSGSLHPINRRSLWNMPALNLNNPSMSRSAPAEPLPNQQASQAQAARSASRLASVHDSAQQSSLQDAQQPTMEQLVGEVAFQLDRRILSIVFPDHEHLYGFTVANIPEKLMAMALGTIQTKFDVNQCVAAVHRYLDLMTKLQPLRYSPAVHPAFAESLINTYGFLRRPLSSQTQVQFDPSVLRNAIDETVPVLLQDDAMVLLLCLQELARLDGKPLFL